MARNNSFVKLEGTLDGLTFYNKDGKNFVKTKSKVSRKRIMNDPAYRRTRENMKEFGGAAKIGKAFRDGFAGLVSVMGDTYLSARVNAIMKRINSLGAGLRGERDFDIISHREQFANFEFDNTTAFDTIFYAPFDVPSITASRDVIQWDIPDFDTDSFVRVPEGATHFKLVLGGSYVNSYAYNNATKNYEPTDDAVNGRGNSLYSAAISIGGPVGAATNLTLDLSSLGAIPASSALFVGIGIVFYQDVNGSLYALAQDNAMKIVTSA